MYIYTRSSYLHQLFRFTSVLQIYVSNAYLHQFYRYTLALHIFISSTDLHQLCSFASDLQINSASQIYTGFTYLQSTVLTLDPSIRIKRQSDWLRAGWPQFDSQQTGCKGYPLSLLSSTHRCLFAEVKGQMRESDRSSLSGSKVKKSWSVTSSPPYVLITCDLIKHRDT